MNFTIQQKLSMTEKTLIKSKVFKIDFGKW